MTHNTRNMLLIGLVLIAMLATMAATCDTSGSIDSAIDVIESNSQGLTDWGNDMADDVSKAAEDAGVPACVSCEIYDNLTD